MTFEKAGPGDYHAKWSKSGREGQKIIWNCLYVESKKWLQMNLPTKEKQSYKWRKYTYGYQGVRRGEIIGRLGLAYTQYW